MLICNVTVAGEGGSKDISIANSRIEAVSITGYAATNAGHEGQLWFEKALAFPGLINSHDHLDFNLFPALKSKVYDNYTEWGKDIHKVKKDEINKVLKVPVSLRVKWGVYKNLLNGFTTVVNHGDELKIEEELINVFQQVHSLHSVVFEKNWRWKINDPLKKKWPFAIHAGEGKDAASKKEIDTLLMWNIFRRQMVGIHGVAMDIDQADHFRALVWCPASNYFLLDKTARIDVLKENTKIIFGSDSTLTSCWNIWEHIRLARSEKMLTDFELFSSLTTEPAGVWNMQHRGTISKSKQADIVVVRNKNESAGFECIFSTNPQDILMVMHMGSIRLFDIEMKPQIDKLNYSIKDFSKIKIGGAIKYVQGDLPGLISNILKEYPEAELPFSLNA